ncbi:MAG: biotin-dependent carboxyltransferase family protein, partial [Pseudomonadota bacterium]
MTLRIINAGLQSTLQGEPRRGQRHLGVPTSGPADPLSMALANRLVGNPLSATAIEITLSPFEFECRSDVQFAVTGAASHVGINGAEGEIHNRLEADVGDRVTIVPAEAGARAYLAIAGGLSAKRILRSTSTYLPAEVGGYQGRALAAGDKVLISNAEVQDPIDHTPDEYRPPLTHSWALRCTPGAEFELLDDESRDVLFSAAFVVAQRSDRMGLQLDGNTLGIDSDGKLPSDAVFPGTIQCPENGVPFMLSVDAQTTGG